MPPAWLQRRIAEPPGKCAVCGAWPAQPLCPACVGRFAAPCARCRCCALPLPGGVEVCGACVREAPPLDACFAAVNYAYPWSGLVARFKFQGEAGWAASFAARLRDIPGLAGELGHCDLLLPLPLAPRRLAERGFNQALLLARALDARRTEPRLLLRVRETGAQAALDRRARQANVQGAFALEPLRAAEVRGASVLLVDDVMTSGASLHAAARVLGQAGASRVSAVVLARTDEP
ncbi:MAG TPA: phosphoribosyltransferase family protein [Ramlibacter sp.]|uniref:ComF family protein n=1 Tax=Ramlibacter sp. TaxID=1917967 RepID=UPI002ED31F13